MQARHAQKPVHGRYGCLNGALAGSLGLRSEVGIFSSWREGQLVIGARMTMDRVGGVRSVAGWLDLMIGFVGGEARRVLMFSCPPL